MIKTRAARDLFAYWDRLAAGRQAPRRDEIAPRDVKRHLGEMFILELERPGLFRFRLAGTGICALYGAELRGEAFADLWQGESRLEVVGLLERVIGSAEPTVMVVTGESVRERRVRLEILLLPMAAPDGRLSRVLGCIAALEQPFWLGNDPLVRQRTDAVEALAREDDAGRPRGGEGHLTADETGRGPVAMGPDRPRLRLVKTDA